jgi:demethylmenaquinone methyltransferase/2-methoxy-6-polyprenyl-1,4-benzoquinol methylase
MKDQYQNIASWYDRIFEPINSGLRQIGLKMYPIEKGKNVLDIGCGTGAHLKLYQDENCNVFGVDVSESMLKIAKNKLGKNADLRLCNATNTGYSDRKFDLILITTVLHEMSHQVRTDVLKEARRILKEDGRIILIDFHAARFTQFKWIYSKIIITISEIIAGGEHYKNYRQFMKSGGLSNLIDQSGFEIENKKIVSGGNIGIFLLKA